MPVGLSPTSLTATPTTPISPVTLTTDEQAEGQTPAAESDPMTTQMDSVSDAENPEHATEDENGRENGVGKNHQPHTGRRHSKSNRVSRRERKAMKVLPVVVGMYQFNSKCWVLCFSQHKCLN